MVREQEGERGVLVVYWKAVKLLRTVNGLRLWAHDLRGWRFKLLFCEGEGPRLIG